MQPTLAPAPPPPQHHLAGPNTQDTDTAEQVAEIALRAHLLQNMHSPPKGNSQSPDQAGSVTSHDENINIDPAISGVGTLTGQPPQPIISQGAQIPDQSQNMGSMSPDMQGSPGDSGSQDSPKRGGKRELSTSKRAAQNRAAQRAFRQRKEGYIKKLEEQVRDLNALEESYKQIQNENYQLRDYIISLQSRLIESQGEDAVPPAPILIAHQPPMQQQQLQAQALINAQVPQHGALATVVAPQQGAPTANMGIAAPATHHHQAPQMGQGMMGAPAAQPQAENGQKRSLEEESASSTFTGYVAKKLKGASDPIEQQQATTEPKSSEVNGSSS